MGLPLHGAVNFLYQGIGIARYATFVRSTFGTTVARDQLVPVFALFSDAAASIIERSENATSPSALIHSPLAGF